MSYMFSDCYSLKELDLSSFDTHNVKNYENMFSGFAYDYSMGDGSFEGTIYISDKWTLPESLLSSANASHYTLKN